MQLEKHSLNTAGDFASRAAAFIGRSLHRGAMGFEIYMLRHFDRPIVRFERRLRGRWATEQSKTLPVRSRDLEMNSR